MGCLLERGSYAWQVLGSTRAADSAVVAERAPAAACLPLLQVQAGFDGADAEAGRRLGRRPRHCGARSMATLADIHGSAAAAV